jgi:tRNA(Ile)-lysidine synthase
MTPWGEPQAKLHHTLRSRQLLPKSARILIAVSGGQDSLALAQLMLDLQSRWGWELGIAHCNHRWRHDADANALHVKTLAHQWGLGYWEAIAPVPPLGEAAARQWRYAELTNIAQRHQYSYILTGHTASDRAETLLYNLIRGSGTDGLAALTWQRPLGQNLALIRPLLNWSREDTGQFCRDRALPIWEDSTNADPSYARNRLRLEVLPYLRQHFNPQTDHHLAQTAELLSADVDCLETLAESVYQQAHHGDRRLDRSCLTALPLALQRRVLRRFLQHHLQSAPNFQQIEKLLPLITAPERSRSDPFPGGAIAQVQQNAIALIDPQDPNIAQKQSQP